MRSTTRRLPMLFVLVVTLAALAGLQCDAEENLSILNITITAQPVGGSGVNTVSCTYNGLSFNSVDEGQLLHPSITVQTHWESSHGIYNEESHNWTEDDQHQTFTSSKSAPSGMYLDKPFWFVIRWTDKDGPHRTTSDTAYCQ